MSWWISSPSLCSAWESPTGVGRALLMAPPLPGARTWWQKVVTMTRLPSSTPLVTTTTIGMISLLFSWPVLVMNSTLAFPHIDRDVKWAKCLSDTIWNQRAPRNGISWMDLNSSATTIVKKDLLGSLHSTWRSLIVTSWKKGKHH